jgi:hypothetical protein
MLKQRHVAQDNVFRAPCNLVAHTDLCTRRAPTRPQQSSQATGPFRIGLRCANHSRLATLGGLHDSRLSPPPDACSSSLLQGCSNGRIGESVVASINQVVLADAVTQTVCEACVQVRLLLAVICEMALYVSQGHTHSSLDKHDHSMHVMHACVADRCRVSGR